MRTSQDDDTVFAPIHEMRRHHNRNAPCLHEAEMVQRHRIAITLWSNTQVNDAVPSENSPQDLSAIAAVHKHPRPTRSLHPPQEARRDIVLLRDE